VGENRRIKKIYAEERLESEIREESLENVVRPSQRREMAKNVVETQGLSTRPNAVSNFLPMER
jgi:hypothetical protein